MKSNAPFAFETRGKLARETSRSNQATLILMIAFSILLGLPEFLAPISADTAIYAYSGRAIAEGQVLYRDIWDFKSPGIYYLFSAIFQIFPDTLFVIRLFAQVWVIVTGILFWNLAHKHFASRVAEPLTLFFIVVTNLGSRLNADGPFPETFMPGLVIITMLIWHQYRLSKKPAWIFVAGVVVSHLVLFKQSGLAAVAGFTIAVYLDSNKSERQNTIRNLIVFSLGMLTTFSSWLLFFYVQGALGEMLAAVIEYPLFYIGSTNIQQAGLNFLALFLGMIPSLGLLYVMVPFGLWVLRNRIRNNGVTDPETLWFLIFAIWGVIELFSISISRRFYERYLLLPLVPMLLIAGLGIKTILKKINNAAFELRDFVRLSFLVALILSISSQLPRAFHWIDDRLLKSTQTRSELISEYFVEVSKPNGVVFAWGDPRVPFVANMRSIKWINTEPFLTAPDFISSSVINEVFETISAIPPQYFIDSPARPNLSDSYLGGTIVDNFIQENYKWVTQIGDADLYEYQGEALDD